MNKIMAIKKHTNLYDSVINITADYLGPAAQRFIDRQIENHLKKEPAELKPKDLEVLTDWSRLALALLTEDKKIISEFTQRLNNLAKS